MLAFLLEAVLVSLSGVMAPGPLSATVVARGSESPHAGAVVAIGHGIVELPLMACILLGLGFLLEQFYVRVAMALVGGLFLSVMGVGMLRSIKRPEFAASKNTRSSMVAGIVLSAGNPYLHSTHYLLVACNSPFGLAYSRLARCKVQRTPPAKSLTPVASGRLALFVAGPSGFDNPPLAQVWG